MGVLNEDGLAVIAGVAIGAVGTVLAGVAIWILLAVAFAVGEIVEHAVDGEAP